MISSVISPNIVIKVLQKKVSHVESALPSFIAPFVVDIATSADKHCKDVQFIAVVYAEQVHDCEV